MTDAELAADARRELLENILPFWRRHAVDRTYGGFIGEMSNDLRIREEAPRGLILNARILWTFSAVWTALGRTQETSQDLDPVARAHDYLSEFELARRAEDCLTHGFLDQEFGGYYWELTPEGDVLDATKKIYGQAFCIYALSARRGRWVAAEALQRAIAVFRLIEAHAHDARYGGYVETLSRDWKPVEDMRLSDKDMNAAKSMNNHLHLLEAYTSLFQAWPDAMLGTRLRELIDLFRQRILNRDGTHFNPFFDDAWAPQSASYTFGHDIEGSWLLCEAADVLGDTRLQSEIRDTAVKIAWAVLNEGVDKDGGLFYEARDGNIINAGKEWWPQAEAVVGFYNAFQRTGHDAFRDAAVRCWLYIQNHVVDKVHGEWFWRIRPDGTPDPAEPKISAWKCPYHNSRCCLEIIRRTQSQDSPRSQA